MQEVIVDELVALFNGVWPTMLITCVVAITIRVAYIIIQKPKFIFYKEVIYLLFMIYIIGLFHVVTFQDVTTGGTNFIPFAEIFKYQIGTPLFLKNIIGNIFIFSPFGLLITYIIKTKKIYPIIIISFITSLTIEVTQLGIGRVFDVDDIILNVIGAIIGYFIYKIMELIKNKLPEKLKKNYIYNILIAGVLIIVIVYIVNIYSRGI